MLAGGFPCQDISQAGKRAGIEGEHSGLWSHFLRLIGELRPHYVFVENVSALLAPQRERKRIVGPAPLASVLGGLAACGYDAEWEVLPASAFGAPHFRQRVFLVAYPHCERLQTLQSQPCVFPETAPTWQDVLAGSRGALTWRQNRERLLWQAEPGVDRVADGVPHWMERIHGLGNAVVPQVAQFVGECILAYEEALFL